MSRFVKYPPPVPDAHPLYPASIDEARKIQNHMRERIDIEDRFGPLGMIAGVDVGYDIKENQSRASIVVLRYPELTPTDAAIAFLPTGFPYVPGFLSFRELPVIVEGLKKLKAVPDMILVDGQGIAHPRRVGIATALGLTIDVPTIGVGKSRLTGMHVEPGMIKGDRADLIDRSEKIGTVLRSKDGVKPLFISPGHRVGHESAVEIVLSCLTKYRLPEPTRLADKHSKIGAGELEVDEERDLFE